MGVNVRLYSFEKGRTSPKKYLTTSKLYNKKCCQIFDSSYGCSGLIYNWAKSQLNKGKAIRNRGYYLFTRDNAIDLRAFLYRKLGEFRFDTDDFLTGSALGQYIQELTCIINNPDTFTKYNIYFIAWWLE